MGGNKWERPSCFSLETGQRSSGNCRTVGLEVGGGLFLHGGGVEADEKIVGLLPPVRRKPCTTHPQKPQIINASRWSSTGARASQPVPAPNLPADETKPGLSLPIPCIPFHCAFPLFGEGRTMTSEWSGIPAVHACARVRALRLPGCWFLPPLIPRSVCVRCCCRSFCAVSGEGQGGGEPRIFGLLATPQLFFSGVQPLSHFLTTFALPYHLLCSALFFLPSQPVWRVAYLGYPRKGRVRGCFWSSEWLPPWASGAGGG